MSKEIIKKIDRGGVFPDEETFNRIYDECLENEPMASDRVKKSYNKMGKWFDEYLSALQSDLFRYAYQCGYEAGRKDGVAV